MMHSRKMKCIKFATTSLKDRFSIILIKKKRKPIKFNKIKLSRRKFAANGHHGCKNRHRGKMSDINFKSNYLTNHLITYIGNKRKLLPFINDVVNDIKKKLDKEKISIFDGFSGSGSVARLFKYHATELY